MQIPVCCAIIRLSYLPMRKDGAYAFAEHSLRPCISMDIGLQHAAPCCSRRRGEPCYPPGRYIHSALQSELVPGDVNGDGQLNVADVVLLQRWLLAVPDTMLADWQAGDLCRDGLLNGADLAAVKAILVQE